MPDCDRLCQKILLCMSCAAYGLLAQDSCQRLWQHDKNELSEGFKSRQAQRLAIIQSSIDTCFDIIGKRDSKRQGDLRGLSDQLMELSRPRSVHADNQRVLIGLGERCEDLISDNEADWLKEIGYVAT